MKLWASCLLLMSLPLAAQHPAADKPPEKGSAKGIALKVGSDEPVRRAALRLRSAEDDVRNYQATTDAEGRFEIKDIEPGRYSLDVEREGYRVHRLGVGSVWTRNREGVPVTVGPGQKLDIVAYLVPGGVVAGRVLDADGEPVSNAEVQALRYVFYAGKKRLVPVGQTESNDLGEYRLHGLQAGRYYLQAHPQRGWNPAPALAAGSSPDSEPMVYAPMFYPSVAELSDATPLEIKPGEEERVDFFLVPTRAVRVAGRLAGATAEPGTRVMLAPADGLFGGFRENAKVEKDGTFQFDAVLPGSYTLIAFNPSPQGFGHVASQKLDVGTTGVADLALTMAPAGKTAVRGRVRLEGTTSVDPASLLVFLEPAEVDDFRRFMNFSRRGSGTVKSNGTFEFEEVSDGTYRVTVTGRRGMGWSSEIGGLYLKWVTVGNRDARDEGFTISEGRVGGPLEIVLSAAAAQIEGIVLDDQQRPAAGVRVVAAPEEKRRHFASWYKNGVTDQNGKFVMRGVRPGAYTVLAWDSDGDFYGYNDPDKIQKYENKGVNISVNEKENKTVQLKAIKVEEEP